MKALEYERGYCDKDLVDGLTPLAEAYIQKIKELLEDNNITQE